MVLSKLNYNLTLIFIFSFSVLILPQSVDTLTAQGKLTVIVTGFESDEGNCRFAIDNSKEFYESEDTVWIGKVLPIKNKEVIVTLDSLPYGVYAIKVYQDKNKNRELDTDFLGIPTENYGFSNDASSWFGPPSWDKAKFIFNKPEMILRINID